MDWIVRRRRLAVAETRVGIAAGHVARQRRSVLLRGREEILVAIMELAERLDVAFAVPTRTVIVEQALSEEVGASSVLSQTLPAAVR
jgi:hypothetical protein